MAKSIPTSGIRDNHTRGIVADFLKSRIKESSHLSIVSAFFTIHAYEALKDHLENSRVRLAKLRIVSRYYEEENRRENYMSS